MNKCVKRKLMRYFEIERDGDEENQNDWKMCKQVYFGNLDETQF